MSAFPPSPYDGEVYSIGPRSWTWSTDQQGCSSGYYSIVADVPKVQLTFSFTST